MCVGFYNFQWTRWLFFIKTDCYDLDLNQLNILQGKRANKARKLVKELIDDGGEEDDKNNSSHADSK